MEENIIKTTNFWDITGNPDQLPAPPEEITVDL